MYRTEPKHIKLKSKSCVNGAYQRRRVAWWLVLILVYTVYTLIYINKTFPVTEGWGINYALLLDDGRFPYRDFYYYLPPLNLFLDSFLWSFSFDSFLLYRCYRFIERLILVSLLYFMMSRKRYNLPLWAVWISCLASSVIGTATVYDLVGDYNQTAELLFVVVGCFVLLFFESNEAKRRGRLIFLAGTCTGLLFLMKQSSGLGAILVFSVALICMAVRLRDPRYIKDLALAAISALIPIVLCMVWLFFNGALESFFEQVFSGNSKGGITYIVFGSVLDYIKQNVAAISFAALIIVYFMAGDVRGGSSLNQHVSKLFSLVAAACLPWALWPETMNGLAASLLSSKLCVVAIAVSVAVFLAAGRISQFVKSRHWVNLELENVLRIVSVATCICFLLWVMATGYKGIALSLYPSDAYSIASDLTNVCFLVGVGLLLVKLLNPDLLSALPASLCGLVLAGVASAYAGMMASGGGVVNRSMFVCGPVVLVALFLLGKNWTRVKNGALIAILISAIVICGAQKAVCSYSWWGWEEDPVWSTREVPDSSFLRGFELSTDDANMYNEITKVIEKNADSNTRILGFPHCIVFNILTGHVNEEQFAPVLFYDVCSDEVASLEAKEFEADPPEIVVWCDIPDCLSAHEMIFRNGGRLGQRDIQDWFAGMCDDSYTLIGQAKNIFVYKLNKCGKPTYTYIENPEAVNTTAVSGSR